MAGPPPSTTEDIRKMGLLIKIKTNKRKYFVLRDETKSSSARLEYYDNEKKWRTGSVPKRTIVLKNCFNINSKLDAKHKYAIALYTKDDCFAVACQSEEEQQDWLSNMIELRSRNPDESTITRPLFEHIWPVTVKSKGLGGNERKVVPGQYRLCLTNKDLSLIRVNNDQNDIVLPLDCIRRCGHANQFFFLELGRSAKTGSGNLWLQVEDMVIAQNIHEALLSSMKNNEVPAPGVFRFRSGSSAMEKGRKRPSVTANPSGTMSQHALPKRSQSIYTSNPSPNLTRESLPDGRALGDESSICFTSGSASGMTSTVDGTIEEEPAKDYMMITPIAGDQSVGKTGSKRCSMASSGPGTEGLKSVKSPGHVAEATPILISGVPTASVGGSTSSSWPERSVPDRDDYVPMTTPPEDGYMEMSTRRLEEPHGAEVEEHGSNSSVSSVMSSVGSTSMAESSERSFHSLSQLQEVAIADGGYIEMASPQNLNELPVLSSIRPDVVPCYVRDDGPEDFPKRAYSVGSKPVLIPNKPLNNSYIDMSGKAKVKKEAEKSSSAPHLNDDDEKKRELSDLFMELDFNRSKRGDFGLKDRSSGKEFREWTSTSGGSRDLRAKAMSFSTKEAIQRLFVFSGRNKASAAVQQQQQQQHADGRRPRTSTICQESLRPRTSSFGPTDLRPRASSGGNACFVDVMSSKQLQMLTSGQASQDLLRRHSQRSSQESVDSGKSDAYLNMNLGRRSSDQLGKMIESDAGYIDMKPGDDRNSDYMMMGSGTGAATSSATSCEGLSSTRSSHGVLMRQKLETVQAGSGEDYMEMMAENSGGSTSLPKARGSASVTQPKPRITKSLIETGSSYMTMAPGGASSDKGTSSSKKDALKDVPTKPKCDSYMEMTPGGASSDKTSSANSLKRDVPKDVTTQRRHNSSYMEKSSGAGKSTKQPQNHCSGTGAALPPAFHANHVPGDGAKSKTSLKPSASSSRKEVPKASASERKTATEDTDSVQPPLSEASIPVNSFRHYTDHVDEHNTPGIPNQLTASRTPSSVSGGGAPSGSIDEQEAADHHQISYATLDLGSSVDDNPVAVATDTRGPAAGRGRGGFGQGSVRHVYAQIDFGKVEEHNK